MLPGLILALAAQAPGTLTAPQEAADAFQQLADTWFPGLDWEAPGVLSFDPVAAGSGVWVDPMWMPVDAVIPELSLEIDIGDDPLPRSEGIRICLGDPDAFRWNAADYQVWSEPLLTGLDAVPGAGGGAGRHLRVTAQQEWPSHTRLFVKVRAAAGLPGLWLPQASNPQFLWVVRELPDPLPGHAYEQLPVFGGALLPRPPYRLLATLPAVARPGERTELRLAVLDERDNPAPGFSGSVELTGSDGRVWTLPPKSLAAGHARLPFRLPDGPRFFEVVARAPGLGAGRSNATILLPDAFLHGRGAVWTDLQIHSRRTDGSGPLRWLLYRAAAYGSCDALGFADHDRLTPVPRRGNYWEVYLDELDRPAPFGSPLLAIPGYEWTRALQHPDLGPGSKGHRCVFFSDTAALQPVRRSDLTAWDSLGELLPDLAMRPGRIVAIPHHLRHFAWWDPDGAALGEVLQYSPVAEVLSRKGNYEEDDGGLWRPPHELGPIDARFGAFPGHSWLRGLQEGMRTGAVGGSDTHWGYGGLWVRPADARHAMAEVPNSWRAFCDTCNDGERRWRNRRGALTAVLSSARTRDGVLAALQQRRSYATSGPQIGLWYLVDGQLMGSEVPGPGGPVVVEGFTTAETPVLAVEVRRVGPGWSDLHTTYSGDGHTRHLRFRWIDPSPPAEPWLAYYVRVRVQGHTLEGDVQLEEERAVGSPVWLDF